MCSRGSVIPLFVEQISTGILAITDPNMTRFMTLDDAVDLVCTRLNTESPGGLRFMSAPLLNSVGASRNVR